MKTNFYSISFNEFSEHLSEINKSEISTKLIFSSIYKQGLSATLVNPKFSPKTLKHIKDSFSFELPLINQVVRSKDGTVKFLNKLHDGNIVESVLLPFRKKYTFCLSTQVGCQMNCSFCFTGTEGLTRHLSSDEIVGQYITAFNWLKENSKDHVAPPNIVYMGQGEPLHNFENTKRSAEIFTEHLGLDLGERQITISTCGYLPGLERVNELPLVNIALSLHSPFNDTRSSLIPINKKYPIEEVVNVLKGRILKKKQYINIEYLLIKGINDKREDAEKLHDLLEGLKVFINLIPFNDFNGTKYKRPSDEEIESFKEHLVEFNFRTMLRGTKGSDIDAACGQLKGNKNGSTT